jgi:hypothetical protein
MLRTAELCAWMAVVHRIASAALHVKWEEEAVVMEEWEARRSEETKWDHALKRNDERGG